MVCSCSSTGDCIADTGAGISTGAISTTITSASLELYGSSLKLVLLPVASAILDPDLARELVVELILKTPPIR